MFFSEKGPLQLPGTFMRTPLMNLFQYVRIFKQSTEVPLRQIASEKRGNAVESWQARILRRRYNI